jgi:(S)-ureidoglycine aminohydrolase
VHNLGHTRSSQQRDHMLLTPDTFVRIVLPGMKNAEAVVHVAPALGARFAEYTVEFAAGGELGGTTAQRFLYVVEGGVTLEAGGGKSDLGARAFAYVPQGMAHRVCGAQNSRVIVIEKPYAGTPGAAAPTLLVSSEDAVTSEALDGDSALQVKHLLPDEFAFDFAVNSMVYQPGASLSMVEMHVMEHGLMMLEGGGIYRLGDSWYPVTAGDFVWMGPWCAQWFGAIGKVPAKYLIYKDWNRHPLETPQK